MFIQYKLTINMYFYTKVCQNVDTYAHEKNFTFNHVDRHVQFYKRHLYVDKNFLFSFTAVRHLN